MRQSPIHFASGEAVGLWSPVWHQKRERVESHILVCFLPDVLWKKLAQFSNRAWIGNEPAGPLHVNGLQQ